MTSRRIALLSALVLALGLGGCITLFPKTKPVQLYRFDAEPPPAAQAAAPAAGAGFAVRMAPIDFDHASSGDRILTTTGDQAAYIAGGRWVEPASQLFEAAIRRGFAAGPARLVGPGEAGQARDRLRIEVVRFEAQYANGPSAAPTVVVRLHASLSREKDSAPIGSRDFDAAVPASANSIGAIVQAFSEAVTQVAGGLTAWVDQAGG